MMRGPEKSAMAVRNPAGEIVLEEWDTEKSKRKGFLKWPFVRGIFNFIDSMKSGYKCLMRSAEISGLEELEDEIAKEKAEKKRAKAEKKGKTVQSEGKESSALVTVVMVISTCLGIALAVLLFVFAPTWLSTLILGPDATSKHEVWVAVLSGVFKVIILVAYMAIVSLMKDIRRTFMYHGAEHKTIFCYEQGLPLTVENVKKQRRFHPRCGTSFLILMVLVSIFIMIPVGVLLKEVLPAFILANRLLYTLIRTGIAIILMPLIMGIGYELIRVAGRHDNWLTRAISAPGVWLQHITTKEPDDSMIECAIAAMEKVIPEDGSDKQ
ncbi:MAG: DUF1385 domain-containing protein [Ruminococcaceae bacterium]|nr:DUF1385 domain-containing protein [Oscillospiraceae bacterium]